MLNFDFELVHSKKTYKMVNGCVYLNGDEVEYHRLPKQFVVKLCEVYLAKAKEVGTGFSEGVTDFDSLFRDTVYAVNAKTSMKLLRETHCQNSGNSYRRSATTASDKFNNLVNSAFYDILPSTYESIFSLPQQKVIDKVLGSCSEWGLAHEFEELFNSVENSTKKMEDLLKEYREFPFSKYDCVETIGKIQSVFDKVKKEVELFRKFRDYGGADIVNWGPHKVSAVAKKLGVEKTWTVENWLKDAGKNLLANGESVKVKKLTKAEIIFEKHGRGETLTQVELVSVFKNSKNLDSSETISEMEPQTALGLLDETTKVVKNLLIDRDSAQPALDAIIVKACETPTVEVYSKVLTYLHANEITTALTWDFLNAFKEHVVTVDVLESNMLCSKTELSEEFYQDVLVKLYPEKCFTVNGSISHAFLAHESVAGRNDILKIATESDNPLQFNWGFSSPLFYKCDYGLLKDFMFADRSRWEYFKHLVVERKDKKTARELIDQYRSRDHDLFKTLPYDERREVFIPASKNFNTYSAREIFADSLKEFTLSCFKHESLVKLLNGLIVPCKWGIDTDRELVLSKDDVNKVVSETSIHDLYIPADSGVISFMSKQNRIKIIQSYCMVIREHRTKNLATKTEDATAKEALYAGITRADFNRFSDTLIVKHKDSIYLAHLMSEKEIVEACVADRDFFEHNIELVPAPYIDKFSDIKVFKELVGNGVLRENKFFRKALMGRIANLVERPSNFMEMFSDL